MGTRLYPLTRVTNKHLLPIGGEPMIFHSLRFLVESGITEIMLVTGGNCAGDFLTVLGNGEEFGLRHLAYTYQPKPAGIADALGRAEHWVGRESVCVLLGDNVFEKLQGSIQSFPARLLAAPGVTERARIYHTRVVHPEHYGVVTLAEPDHAGVSGVVDIEEKPAQPASNQIAVGLYLYDSSVWERIRAIKPSGRGELEITDINRSYARTGDLGAMAVDGWWADCGENVEVYMEANQKVWASRRRSGR